MCGQAAYIGGNFSPMLFKLMAMGQDYWGGDGAGVCVYNPKAGFKVEHCLPSRRDKVRFKRAYDFIHRHENLASDLSELLCSVVNLSDAGVDGKFTAAFAHTRKATVGAIKREFLQPILLQADGDELVVMHNGTITNYQQLAKDYGLEGDNDSQVLSHAIKTGQEKEFFEMYTGAIACIWYWKKSPHKLYVYVGASETDPNKASRALHYANFGHGVYISKDLSTLEQVCKLQQNPGDEETTMYHFALNCVTQVTYKETGSTVEVINSIPRKPARTNTTVTYEQNKKEQYKLVQYMVEDTFEGARKGKLHFHRGVYTCDGRVVNTHYLVEDGECHISKTPYVDCEGNVYYRSARKWTQPDGKRLKKPKVGSFDTLLPLYFLDGIMLRNRSTFQHFILKHQDKGKWSIRDLIGYTTHPLWCVSMSAHYQKTDNILSSMLLWHPPTLPWVTDKGVAKNFMDGKFTPLFSTKEYTFSNGKVHGITTLPLAEAQSRWITQLEEAEKAQQSQEADMLARKVRVLRNSITRALDRDGVPTEDQNYKLLNQIKKFLDGHAKKVNPPVSK